MPAHPLRQRALGAELDLELAGEELAFELLVFAHIAADHLLHLLGAQQLADPFIIDPGIVAGEGEVLNPAVANRVEQSFGDAAKAETSAGDQHVVLEHAVECGGGIGVEFLHGTPAGLG